MYIDTISYLFLSNVSSFTDDNVHHIKRVYTTFLTTVTLDFVSIKKPHIWFK